MGHNLEYLRAVGRVRRVPLSKGLPAGYASCEHGPRIPKWGKAASGRYWANYSCPVRVCDPLWENDPEHIYDAWASRMQDEIYSLRPEWTAGDDAMMSIYRAGQASPASA
jgi:hypothetical protein